ncbi:unnamed protein product [Kuraishia capsulata CBS 1993]|uniref:Acyl-coenzyme A oxidase n=1 Tax=Kuraishia capsulata CBS 1993 TaxID=1382522 RepID=W6MXA8_9ASCO|nr:uncharacterized protein KUCA_T00004548001 [Kuraishia capsulata CBS 1993]CDK28565.1 unnamed protein product [Kuraishia capsulata CBS 1993]
MTLLRENQKGPRPATSIWAERDATDFDINKMHVFLEGSEEGAAQILKEMQEVERDPILKTDETYYDMTKAEHREVTARKIGQLAKYIEQDGNLESFERKMNLMSIVDPQLTTRVGIHLKLFLACINGTGTDAQFNYWAHERGALFIRDVYGCFGMTEMAHGSNVAALETTATYRKETKDIVINTPHVGATKWWIGGAAHSANHCSVYARLIVDGKDYGVKTFVVPLRDREHELLPGVAIGDIGAKMGRDGIDNGWIQFTNVVIPKEYMLSKYTYIDEDDTVVDPPLAQLSYGALLGGRVSMVTDSFRTSERFITIALRYAVGRRQFASKGKAEENQIINYPLHQKRLFPLLATTYAMSIGSYKIETEFAQTLKQLDGAVRAQDLKEMSDAINRLKNVFCFSACLKSTCTWFTAQLIDECRQACGGHGYSSYSGFGKAYNDWVVQCTWEGDNNILATNAGRIIIQTLQKFQAKGKKPSGDLSFLGKADHVKGNKPLTLDFKKPSSLVDVFEAVVIRLSVGSIEKLAQNGNDWDLIAPERVLISKLNAALFMLTHWLIKLEATPEDGNIKKHLYTLFAIYGLSQIDLFAGAFLAEGVIDQASLKAVQAHLMDLFKEIRPHIIGLTDAFKFSDFFINSGLGFYNGDVYTNYFGIVKKQNDNSKSKAPYSKEFEAVLRRDTLEVRQNFGKSAKTLKKLSE